LLIQVTHDDRLYWHSRSRDAILAHERRLQLDRHSTWLRFSRRVAAVREELPAFLDHQLRAGRRLAAYGASAKGNTLLQYCDIGPERLPYIVDKSPVKQGLLTPGRHIPVLPPGQLLADQPDVTLLLAWNLAGEIAQQQREYRRRGGRFAVPVPAPRLWQAAA
jgi:hypothetical protein